MMDFGELSQDGYEDGFDSPGALAFQQSMDGGGDVANKRKAMSVYDIDHTSIKMDSGGVQKKYDRAVADLMEMTCLD